MKALFRVAGAWLAASMLIAGSAQAQNTTLKVGSTTAGAPFTFLNTKTNQIDGLMVDVTQAISKEAGFGVQIEPMQFSTLIASLTSKRIDMISAAMSITPERLKVINFSNKIYSYGEGIITTKADTKAYVSWDDMQGKTIGVQVGSFFVDPVQKSGKFKEVKLYDSAADLMRDANAGRVDLGLIDYPIAAYAIAQGNFPNLHLVQSYKPTLMNSVGIGVRKDDAELMKKVNTAIDKLVADGTVAKLVAKWGL